jgi:hypothetical protein
LRAMDERTIAEAARAALKALEVDGEVTAVSRPLGGDKWCVQFTGGYGQFCDEFRDALTGKENGPAVVREKVKRYLLTCQRKMMGRPQKQTNWR